MYARLVYVWRLNEYLMLLTTELQRAFLRWRDQNAAISAALDRAAPPLRNLLLQS